MDADLARHCLLTDFVAETEGNPNSDVFSPEDVFKIDRKFIKKIPERQQDEILTSLMFLGHLKPYSDEYPDHVSITKEGYTAAYSKHFLRIYQERTRKFWHDLLILVFNAVFALGVIWTIYNDSQDQRVQRVHEVQFLKALNALNNKIDSTSTPKLDSIKANSSHKSR